MATRGYRELAHNIHSPMPAFALAVRNSYRVDTRTKPVIRVCPRSTAGNSIASLAAACNERDKSALARSDGDSGGDGDSGCAAGPRRLGDTEREPS